MLERFKKSEFSRNVFTLLTGTSIAQAIPLLASPIISRLYTPGDFAVLALYLSIYNLIQIIVTGRYELAMVLPKKDSEAINIAGISLLITGIVSVLALIVLYPLNVQLGIWLKNVELSKWVFLIPFAVFITGLFRTFNFWLIRKTNYKKIATSKISRSITNVGVSIGFGKYFVKQNGLILGQFFGDFILMLSLLPKFLKDFKKLKKHITVLELKNAVKKNKDFPIYNTMHAFSDQFKESGIIAVISYFFLDKTLGLYSFGLRYTKAPISLLTQSFTQVTFQKMSGIKANGDALMPFVSKLIKKLSVISIALFLGIFFLIEILIAFIFGEEWRIAGSYVKILAPYLSLNFITSVISFLPIVLAKQKQFFVLGLFNNLITTLVVLLAAYFSNDIKTTLISMSVVLTINILLILIWFLYLVKRNDEMLTKKPI